MRFFSPVLLIAFFCVTVALFTGCTSRPEIRRDRHPAVSLASYKTFAFAEAAADDEYRYGALVSTRVRFALRAELERRNYVYSERSPDLLVSFNVDVVNREDVRFWPTGTGAIGYSAALSDLETVSSRRGTLSVELVDSHESMRVWRGVADGRISGKALENPGPVLERAVSELFIGFPVTRRGGELTSASVTSRS